MAERSTLNSIARIIVDAFDVDIHIYTMQLLRRLRETPSGKDFVTWAENNPAMFMNLLRGASAVVQRLPKNDNLVIETITDHLKRLPVDIWETTAGARGSTVQSSFSDEEFRKNYEQATAGLSQEELARVAKLQRSRLREWVSSPPSMRTVLIETWSNEPNRMSKAIVFWGIAVAWLAINLLFVDAKGIYLLEDDYGKMVIEKYREYGSTFNYPEIRTSWMVLFSWRFLALYALVFCPFYSFWVICKAIAR